MLARRVRLPVAKRGALVLARMNCLQDMPQSIEVSLVKRRSDVEVSGFEHNTVEHRRGRSRDDVIDPVLIEDHKQCLDIRLLAFHPHPVRGLSLPREIVWAGADQAFLSWARVRECSPSGLGLRRLREGKLRIRRPGVAVTLLLARRL